ncbi:MAG TPA: 23S rRNA (guanosine(2251)-2'-O)-methyltransferase RlmB [Actinomycetes bacterium]
MAGNSQRRGAMRKSGSKKGQVVGSGGQKRRGLRGKGPTPPAAERESHPARRRAAAAAKRAAASGRGGGGRGSGSRSAATRSRTGHDGPETVAGRNPVVEALRAGVPATALFVAERIDGDDRVREALKLASGAGIPLLEAPRHELDRLTGGALHQGLALQVPAYSYAHPDDLLRRATDAGEVPLVVALDGVTDPRNLGAVVRSAAAFGAHGVLVPERRAAGMTAAAWKTSAGAAARVPVARATNLNRALQSYRDAGVFVVGLDADGTVDVDALEVATDPIVLVVGSEGKGLSRLVRESCDLVAGIPITGAESLNAGVAAGIALYEVARKRR